MFLPNDQLLYFCGTDPECSRLGTECPRILIPFDVVSYYVNWVKTFGIFSINSFLTFKYLKSNFLRGIYILIRCDGYLLNTLQEFLEVLYTMDKTS